MSRRQAGSPARRQPDSKPSLGSRLLEWYGASKRRMPWRGVRDPYRIWVSEIMLQQTRVEAVVPFYRAWLKRFPTLRDLARASEGAVLRQWEGLGYYARARNLRRAAHIVMTRHAGHLPADKRELLKLPGIGDYSASAIASIAFGRDEVALDGNVRRVLARVFALGARADTARGTAALRRLAQTHLPPGRAGDFNQALMDLGATICLPAWPHCPACPLSTICAARRRGEQSLYPRVARRSPIPHRRLGAVVFSRLGRVLIVRREGHGLLGGLWEFPHADWPSSRSVPGVPDPRFFRAIADLYGVSAVGGRHMVTIRHAYSHFRVTVHALSCVGRPRRDVLRGRWVRASALRRYPMGRVDRRIADLVQAN